MSENVRDKEERFKELYGNMNEKEFMAKWELPVKWELPANPIDKLYIDKLNKTADDFYNQMLGKWEPCQPKETKEDQIIILLEKVLKKQEILERRIDNIFGKSVLLNGRFIDL